MGAIITSGKALILSFIILMLPGMRFTLAQPASQCLAVITEIKGEAFLRKADRSDFGKVSWGAQLFEGDEIKTAEKSEVKLLFSDRNLISLGPESKIRISGKGSPAAETTANIRNLSSAAMIDLSALIPGRDDKKDAGALAGLRSVTMDRAIELTSPSNTYIKTNRPAFSWITRKSFDSYTIKLYNSKGLVWSKKLAENAMKYPENEKGLEFGESYFWNVEGEYLIDSDKSSDYKFSVLSLEQSKEVQANEDEIRNNFENNPESSSLHSVLGAYYIKKGLLQDAISEFQAISKLNADAALPHELLGSLYSKTGDKDKAIDELQKALTLAKEKEK